MPRGSHDAHPTRGRRLALEPLETRLLLAADIVAPAPPFADAWAFSETLWNASAGNLPLSETFQLESRPGASRSLYLDFNGHVTQGTAWNRKTGQARLVSLSWSLDTDRTTWSRAERRAIQQIWASVAEDFAPFDLNVTTRLPSPGDLSRDGRSDHRWGARVVIGTDPGIAPGSLGIAYIGSFDWGSDTPAFVFAETPNDVALAISHEVGHTLGLRHDGTRNSPYYAGANGWGPIMGNPLGQALTQWSRGEYQGSNNSEDDLAVIASNGVPFIADDVGDTTATAAWLRPRADGQVAAAGRIGKPSDRDLFRFEAGVGTLSFQVDTLPFGGDLNAELLLYDSAGRRIASSNPRGRLDASLEIELPRAGTYTVVVRGAGLTESGVATDYGSLGFYRILATIPPVPSVTAASSVVTAPSNVSAVREESSSAPAAAPSSLQTTWTTFRSTRSRTISASRPSTIASSIVVGNMSGTLVDVAVRVELEHTWVGDLELWLESPDGRRIPLVRRRGGRSDNAVIEFRANAPAPITQARRLFGAYRPEGSLGRFRGLDPNGRWRLIVRDRAYRDGGRLNTWLLRLTTQAAGPAAPIRPLQTATLPPRTARPRTTAALSEPPPSTGRRDASIVDGSSSSRTHRAIEELVESHRMGVPQHWQQILRAFDAYHVDAGNEDQGSEESDDWLNLLSILSISRGT